MAAIEVQHLTEVLRKLNRKWEDVLEINEILAKWMEQQTHLSHIPFDKFPIGKLANAVINCKFSAERCKQNLELYYSIRNILPELYNDWDVASPRNQEIIKAHCVLALPNLTPKEYEMVVVIHFLEPDNFNYWGFIKVIILLCELICRDRVCNGIHVLIDMSNFNLSHLTQLTLTSMKAAHQVFQHVYCLRIFGIHFINTQSFIQRVIQLFKMVLNPKVFNRTQVHQSLESLYEKIPKSMLPKDYGGEQPDILTLYEQQIEEFMSIRDELKTCAQWKSDESKREQKKYDYECLEGTFKRLTID